MFVRTKDGVYEVEQSQLEDDEEVVDCEYGQIGKLEIKSKSESLEELCDEFVVECFNKSYHAISEIGYDELKHNTQTLSPTDTIYGAIWTEWGLKYVAKMNSTGELELI